LCAPPSAAGCSGPLGVRLTERRLEITTAATTMPIATMATPVRRPTLWLYFTTLVATSSETRFMTFSSGLIAGPAVSLNGSPTVSPMTAAACASAEGRGVGLGALAAVVPVLDQLLGVIPGTTGVGQEDRHQHAGRDRARKVGAQRGIAEREPDRDGRQHRQQPRGGQFTERVRGADVHYPAVLGLLGVIHDPRVGAELVSHLDHHP